MIPHLDSPLMSAFKENPQYFLAALLFAVIGLGLLLGAFLNRQRPASMGLGFAAAALGGLAMTCGAVGLVRLRHVTEVVVSTEGLSDGDRVRIRAHDNHEALMPLYFGLAVGSVPLLGGMTLAISGLTRRRKPQLPAAGARM